MFGYMSLLLFTALLPGLRASCTNPSPAFLLPNLKSNIPLLQTTFDDIEQELLRLVNRGRYNNTSFSIEVTSSKDRLWDLHRTSRDPGTFPRRGASEVGEDIAYRIASISKLFTVLGLLQQHAAGNLSLDDPVNRYISALNESQTGTIPWHDVTLRSLASQLSGLPRNVLQGDLITNPVGANSLGLPPLSHDGLPTCDTYSAFERACDASDLYDAMQKQKPVFAPNQKSTYSNDAFSLLGLVLANVTGMSYSDYIRSSIFEPLGMEHTSFERPEDSAGSIPAVDNYWDIELGVQRPTGGIYSSTADMSAFLRYVLTHYNGITPSLNWLNPISFAGTMQTSFGMPWEIFRTDRILEHTRRPTLFATKSGGLPGYVSIVIVAPEYDIGITVLVSGAFDFLGESSDIITVPLIRALDRIAISQLDAYTGIFAPKSNEEPQSELNTTITFTNDPHQGLQISKFISNGTDVLPALRRTEVGDKPESRFQLVPTLLNIDEKAPNGERWRMLVVDNEAEPEKRRIWDDACITDWDIGSYADEPLNEVVFWKDEEGKVEEVGLMAYRITLGRAKGKEETMELNADGKGMTGVRKGPQRALG